MAKSKPREPVVVNITGWKPIASAPQDGTRVRVGNLLDPSSMKAETMFKTTGVYESGLWECTAAFVCLDGMLRWQPTHWMPSDKQAEDA